MEKVIVKAPEGCEYLSQIKELENKLPVNCLFDKGITGCGATTIAIENKKDTIIAMPYVSVIKNKVAQYPNERCNHELLGIYEGVKDDRILDYIKNHEIKKIAVTYDSLERLITLLLESGIDVYNDYYLLVDEYHVLFNSYAFRNKAIRKVLDYGKQFKEVTYMTATPIEKQFQLKELEHLPIVEVQWKNVAPVNVKPIITNQPVRVVCKLIKDAIAGKILGNLHLFVNSVEFIAEAIQKSGLTPEQVRVVCSSNERMGKGNKSNQKKLGDSYKIETTTDSVKPINFYTSTCFEGCDIYDENGKVYIISDKRKSHTLLDISTLIIQICGRIRDSKYKTKIGHIFTETRYNNYASLEEFMKASEEQRAKAKLLVDSINNMPDEARKMDIAIHEKNNKSGLNEMYIGNNNGFLKLDENLMNIDVVNYKITKCLYKHRVLLQSEYERQGFIVTDEKRIIYTDKLAENRKAKISFQELFDEYAMLRDERGNRFVFGNESDRIALIEQERPLVKEAYNVLGIERVQKLNYHVGNIKRALISMQTDISTDAKIIKCLKENGVKEGFTAPTNIFKNILQQIYTSLEIKSFYGKIKTAKATDLGYWFEIKKSTPKINGKTTDCITIINSKMIYV
ncbi:hypothetical protein LJC72_05815 [Bacteroides sp. OttesenSCG-928-D19]|nr:hypothetical protein [Bacteroides sp. OttesenSCG-928-N06]MDL2304842.1 hypothetical protein [Bacteroides sp. OttesenSCG-928-D19]